MKSLNLNNPLVNRSGRSLLLRRVVAAGLLLVSAPFGVAQTLYWDTDGVDVTNLVDGTNLGGSGTWDTLATNWWPVPAGPLTTWGNTGAEVAIFSGGFTVLPQENTVSLSGAISVNQMQFRRSGYTLSGGTSLTLAGGNAGLFAALGESASVSSLLAGTDGLLMTGGGSIRLTNTGNNYTGFTTISNGSLIISDPAALGGTGVVNILTTNSTPLNTSLLGFGGGSLVLDGTAGGFTFARDVDFEGRGPIGDRGAAILSIGNNTLSGVLRSAVSPLPLSPTATIRNSRINSINGALTLSGALTVGGTAGTTLTSLGGVNSAGVGDFRLTGVLAGTGTLQKSGAGALFLEPSDTSGFSGRLRISGSATGQQSSVRITSVNDGLNTTSVFGTANGTTSSAAIDLDGGILEIRSDSSLNFAKNFYHRSTGTVYVGPAGGGTGVNGTFTFGSMAFEDNLTNTFQSRNGYGLSFTTAPVVGSTAGDNNSAITNSMGGTLSFTGNFWSNANNTGNRTLTIGGNGNTIINGNIVASAAAFDHILTKTGTGLLTVTGVGTTLDGAVNLNGGALAITDFRSIGTSNTSVINIGTGTTAGALIIGTATTGTAGGLTTNRVINLAGTTAVPSLYANQPGANPVVINSNIVSTGVGAKTLTLGGSNTLGNILNGSISNAGVAFTPSANAASGSTVLALTSVTGLAVGQNVAGTGIQAGTTITAISGLNVTLSLPTNAARTTEAMSASTGGGAAVSLTKIGPGTWALAGANTFTGTTTIANGTLKLMANAATSTVLPSTNAITFNQTNSRGGSTLEFVGQNGVNNVQTLGTVTTTAGANTLRLTPGTGGTASVGFGSLATSASSTLNIVGADFTNNTVTIAGANGLVSRTVYWNGADYAFRDGNVLRAPVYGADSAFVNAGTALAAGNNLITGDITGQVTQSVVTLKFDGSRNLGLDASATLTLTGAGILATGGSSSITGGTALATGTQALVVRVDQQTDSLTIGSLITGTGGLTVQGAGTLVLTAANTRTGTVTINEGTVQLSGSGRLGNAADLTIRHLGAYDLNGVTPSSNINAFNSAGRVINSSTTAATLTVGGSNGTGTSFGTIEGAINVVKIGTGGQSWLGLNSYSGSTTIGSTGLVTVDTLANIGEDSGIGRGDATSDVTNAASLVFNGTTGGLVYAGAIRNGDLTLGSRSASTNRLFTLAGTGVRLSSSVSNNNAIVWSNPGAIVHAVVGPQLLTFEGGSAGDNTFNPQLTDSGTGVNITRVTKSGTGQWNLGNSNNTYTGVTTVGNGILGLNDNGALPASSPVVLGTTTNGILQLSGIFARDLTSTPTAGTGTITWGGTTGGGGFAAHTTPLTVTLNGGAGLTWGSGGFVGTGGTQALVFNSASALSNVTFTNGIDFGTANRTITVNDNGNTGADYATVSGVLSGAGGGLLKNGPGVLRLGNDNTYTGLTQVQAGTLVVSSLGSSTGGASSSVGASGVAMANTNAIQLGAGGNNSGILQYVGSGEISDRKIRFNSTTGTSSTNQIHADGSGPLILTNVANDMTAGAKTVVLRGSNTAGNMITSVLADNGGALSITVDGGATWILTGANTFTGNLTAGGGALGIGHADAVGANATGSVVNSNGNIFGYGADRSIARNLILSSNTANGWLGDYSLTFNGVNSLAASTGNVTTNNSIVAGRALTLQGLTANALTATRAWTIDGNGETVLNGNFTTSTAFGVNITKTGNGTLTLGTSGASSNWNQAGNNVTLNRGTLRFTADNAIPAASVANGGLVMNPLVSVGAIATLDLNGTTQTVNAFTGNTNGTLTINNTSATAATFRFGANNTNVDFGSGVGTYSILNTGDGPLSLVKLGNTTATFISGITLQHEGITASEGGGVWNIASPLTATTGLRAIEASTLGLSGGLLNPGLITSLEVGGGSTLSLLDGAGTGIVNLTSLNLGNTGTGTVTLNLNVGDLLAAGDNGGTDFLQLLTGGFLNLGNTITFNMTDAGLNPNQTYTLLNVQSGGLLSTLGIGDFIQGATPGGFSSMTWTVNDNGVQLTTGSLLLNDLYWRGSTDLTWNGNPNNWSLDKAGINPSTSIPGQGNKVIFAWDDPGAGPLVTTLEQNFKVNSLVFEAGASSTPNSISITSGVLASARLEIAPQVATDGILISAGGTPVVNIGANLRLGADQTWTTVDAGSVLTVSGALFGEADLIKAGAGTVVLSGVADPTFNAGATASMAINEGTVQLQNLAALGTLANSNVVPITVNSTGAFFTNLAAASTTVNPITLSGGTLSAGGNSQTYSGAVTVSGNSVVNLADSNQVLTGVARNITLSGAITGSGSLTVDGNNTDTGGNQISGTLTINNAASTWNGDLFFNRGTMTISAAASASAGPDDVTFNSFGRLILQGVDGQTINRAGTLVYAAGAVGEFQVDNVTGTQVTGFAVNQNGAVTLGAGGVGATMRVALPDALAFLNITGGVSLGGNSSVSVSNSANRLLQISGVISDGGNGYGLAINDDAGGWGQTNGITRLTGLNTFTGNVSLGGGTLEFDTVTNISGGASSLGNGTAISSTANAILRFVGTTAQSTDRPISSSAGVLTLAANGDEVADSITYNGPITVGPTADGSQLVLTGAAGRVGIITGGFTQTGTSADVNVAGGSWTLSGAQSTIGDDLFVQGVGTVLNLDSTAVVRLMSGGASSDLSIRNGGVVNINADNAVQYVGTPFRLFVGQGADGADTVLNLNSNLQSGRLILGERSTTRVGIINGPGTLTVDNAAASFIELYRGEINANLASNGTGAGIFRKIGSGTVTLRGDNSGLTNTGITQVDNGTLVLDYTLNNATKLNVAQPLDMRGATLQIIGNAAAPTLQNVLSFTMATGAGNNIIDVTAGTGQTATLALGAITRAGSAGTLRINLNNSGAAVTTTTANTNGIVGLSAYTTVKDSTGTWFGTNSGGSIIGLASVLNNDVSTWLAGDHISDESTGFTGAIAGNHLNSLRFNAAGGSALNLASAGVLTLASGGILVTDQVTSGSPGIFGGTLGTGVTELIITQDSSQTFEISSRIGVNNGLTKSGPGTLLLTGNSVYTGQTSIQNGALQVNGGNAIGDSSLVTFASNRNATLQLLANETIGRIQGGQRATNSDYGIVDIGAHTLTLNHTGGNTTYSGRFVGSGGLVMSSASSSNLTLAGISTGFTGTVEVNGGLFQLVTSGQINASSITVNGNGMLIVDNNGTTSSTTRIPDGTPLILNSTAGGGTNIRGIWVRNTDNNSSRFETIGNLVFNSGANYLTGEANVSSGNARAGIIANDFIRNDNATVSVRGRNLGTTITHHNQFRIGSSANQTAFISSLIGGVGSAGSATLRIVPWAIGETHNATTTGSANMGNSLVTYVSGAGFRPLDLVTEYANYATAGATNNTRESITTDLTGLTGRSLNSLVIHNNSSAASVLNITGAGAGNGLVNTSGAFLFTLNPAAAASSSHSVTLGGFDDGISVGSSEYVFFVQNPSAATNTPTLTAMIGSALTSAADITKSGRGTLILNQVNTAGGGIRKTTINEGVLEIGDLDHIGGDTGNLVFAGGTMRLGTGFADDLSSRSISFLTGGGTLDTNGIDISLANSLGSGVGGFTKAGLGNLTLNAGATYTGNTVLALGTVTVGANNALGVGGNLTLAAGTTLALGANTVSHHLVTTSGASPAITGTGTINASGGFFFNHTGNTVIGATLAGAGGLLKGQTNVLTLNGVNSYSGVTEIRAGGLSIDSIANVAGGASALGSPATTADGGIRMGLTTAATSLTYTGSGHTSDRLIGMQGTTGGVTLNGSGAGAVGYGGAHFETPGNKTLTLGGSSDVALINSIGLLKEIGGVMTVLKTDANTWSMIQSNAYSGATSINNGVLRLDAEQNLTGALNFGSANNITTAGRLEVNESASFGSLVVQTNSAVNTNQLSIAVGKTLQINGNATIGSGVGALSNTLLTATGAGTLNITNLASAAQFRVGGSATAGNVTEADFSGLTEMVVSLNTTNGILRVNSTTGTNVNNTFSIFKLPEDTTVTAATLAVGDGGQYNGSAGQVNQLQLGAGETVFNVNTVNIGTGARDLGSVTFQDANGTVSIRAADGTAGAAFNMGTGTAVTAVALSGNQNTFDVTGHDADLKFSSVNIGTQNRNADLLNVFSFDTGTLEIGALTASTKGSNGNTTTTNINIGGGTVTTGAWTLATTTGNGNAVATANLTGGNITFSGSINRGTDAVGGGTATGTVNLNGATLDMGGNSIGSTTNQIVFNAQSGTLRNLAELNGGGVLTKTTAGSLSLGNGNTYTGGTTVSAGSLFANNTTGSATGSGAVSVASGATLGGSGLVTPGVNNTVTIDSGATLTVGNLADTQGSALTITTSGTGELTINGKVEFDIWSGVGAGDNSAAPLTADRLVIGGGNVVLGGTLAINNPNSIVSWAAGDIWRLFDWALATNVSGSFTNINSTIGNFSDLPDLSGDLLAWDTSNLYTQGTISVVIIPEPSRVLLLMLGGLGWVMRRRRK